MTGRIVLLNGPSSAGKSSIAAAFAAEQSRPWIVFPVDSLHAARSRPDLRADGSDMSDEDWLAVFRRTRAGYHRALPALALAGNDVVGDHVLTEPWRLADLLKHTRDVPVLLVHVTASLDELERREAQRGDRDLGTAAQQINRVFAHRDCDLFIDTSDQTPDQAAANIRHLVADWPQQTAFDRLRAAQPPTG